jgi:hypothetical protein
MSGSAGLAGGWLLKQMAGTASGVCSFRDQLKYVDRDPPSVATNACTRSASERYRGSALIAPVQVRLLELPRGEVGAHGDFFEPMQPRLHNLRLVF